MHVKATYLAWSAKPVAQPYISTHARTHARTASGELNRVAVIKRYRHIINDMYHHDARYPSKV